MNSSVVDMIILILSTCILLAFAFNAFKNSRNKRDEDEDGDGGQPNYPSDPVLDLPPGICLPQDGPVSETLV